MRFNEPELKLLAAQQQRVVIEGTLQYMKPAGSDAWYQAAVFKERTFRLVQNVLFYYRVNEPPAEPLGAFVLEHMEVAYENSGPASFAFSLNSPADGKHVFGCRCQEDLNKWVAALKAASYSSLRSLHQVLQIKLLRHQGANIADILSNGRGEEEEPVPEVTQKAPRRKTQPKASKSTFYSDASAPASDIKDNHSTDRRRRHNVPVENLIDL